MSKLADLMTVVEVAYNPHPAWGYAPEVMAEKLTDGSVRLTAYMLEGDWFDRICAVEEADAILFRDPEGGWPGPECWLSEREYVEPVTPVMADGRVTGWLYGSPSCSCSTRDGEWMAERSS